MNRAGAVVLLGLSIALSAFLAAPASGEIGAGGFQRRLTASDGAAGDAFGSSVSAAGDVIVAGAYGNDHDRGAAYVFERNAEGTNAWGGVAKLTAFDPEMGDRFGYAVAVAGDVIVVGAYGDYDSGPFSGSAYVFERNASGTNAWGQVAKLAASDGDMFFGFSVAVAGDVIVVGALGSGSAYVFERNAGGTNIWGEVTKLTASDPENASFGYSVSVAGDVIAVTAFGYPDKDGGAYVFERNAGGTNAWGQVKKLTATDNDGERSFGFSVSVAGDVIAVAAPGGASGRGAAYVFERNIGGTNAWGPVATVAASDGETNDIFGASVAVVGDVILVGARWDGAGSVTNQGSVYAFERNVGGTNAWGQVAKITASDGTTNDLFGGSVAAAGDVIVVGAYGDDSDKGSAYVIPKRFTALSEKAKLLEPEGVGDYYFARSVAAAGDVVVVGAMAAYSATNDGWVFVYERNGGGTNAWGRTATLISSSEHLTNAFGTSVAADGDVIAVGAPGEDSGRGAAYVFERDAGGTNAWGTVARLVAADGAEGDVFGRAVAVAGDVIVVGALFDSVDEGTQNGSACVFERNAGGTNAWGQVAWLRAPEYYNFEQFGYSVAVAGDVIVVGAPSPIVPAAYVFERNAGGTNAWGQVARLTAPEGESLWGRVAVGGDIVVASGGDGSGHGRVFVFERGAGGTNEWERVAGLAVSDGDDYSDFGASLAVAGDRIVIGAPDDGDRGSAYVFGRDVGGTNAWGQVLRFTPSDNIGNDAFGSSAAAAGDVIVVGACFYASEAKAAYVFEGTYREPQRFTLEAIAGLHGAIMPTGLVEVVEGGDTSFVLSADAYFHIGQLLTNGAPDAVAAGVAAYTSVWMHVTADGTVDVSFAENRAPLGTPEWWLALHELTNLAFSVEETNDVDGDCVIAAGEYIADTDPKNSNSVFTITGIVAAPTCQVSFLCSTARVYSLEFVADPADTDWMGVGDQTNVTGAGTAMSLADTNDSARRLYRVRARLP